MLLLIQKETFIGSLSFILFFEENADQGITL